MNKTALYILFMGLPLAAQTEITASARAGITVREKTGLEIKLVEIPAGEFLMGSNGEEAEYDEKPVHKVIISKPFRMGETEVTNAQYEQFRPEHRALRGKNGVSKKDDDAVVNVSWQDAVDFCNWLSLKEGRSYRLPTEAEWEYACRARTYTLYNTGDNLPHSMLRNQKIVRDYKAVSLKVGRTAPNAFGLCDMHGNVEEWCMDWYGPYSDEEQSDPSGPQNGEYRVTRGGSHNTPVEYLRSSNRMAMLPEDRHSLTGFRVVESEWTPATEQPSTAETTSSTEEPETENISNATETADADLAEGAWATKYDDEAIFLPPRPFISRPKDPAVPFYPHNHQPSITWCDNGDLLAVWFSTNAENGREMVLLSSRLKKGAERWEEPELFFKVPDRNMTGTSIFNDGKGTLYHLNGVEAAGDWQNLIMVMRTSTDNGHTWTAPRIIAPEHEIRHQVISGTLKMPNDWLVQACDAGPTSDDGTAIYISKDGGQTWDDPSDGSSVPKKIKEGGKGSCIAGIHAGVTLLEDGSLLAFGRGIKLAVKEKHGWKRMPMSISTDMGETWEYHASEFPPIDWGQRLVLMRLNEGPLLFVSFTDHPDNTPEKERGMEFEDAEGQTYRGYGLFAAVSYDDGKTWPVKRLLTDKEERDMFGGAWTGMFRMDAAHTEPKGYLAGTQTPDNMIHILSSFLHYRFNLKWLEKLPNP